MHPSWDLRKEWFIFPLKVSLFFLSLSLTETWAYPLILPLCICHRKKEKVWCYRKWDQKWLAQLREHVIRWSGDDYAITRSCDYTWPRGQVVRWLVWSGSHVVVDWIGCIFGHIWIEFLYAPTLKSLSWLQSGLPMSNGTDSFGCGSFSGSLTTRLPLIPV